MKEAVSAILIYKEKIFCIKRNLKMKAFPGYTAFPGGKVDEKDNVNSEKNQYLINALKRELLEELKFDLSEAIVDSINLIATAITPDFNPYRFKTHFYTIKLNKLPELIVEKKEAESSYWIDPALLLNEYNHGLHLMVPPTVKMIKHLSKDINSLKYIDVSLDCNSETEVPYIEPLKNFHHLLPLSKTFPPANRTNCFIVGDAENRLLIDPSPRSPQELEKLLNVANRLKFNKIFLTHHHPDHHEFAPEIARKFNIPILLSRLTKLFLDKKYGRDYLDNIELIIIKGNDVVATYIDEDIIVKEVPGHDNGQLALTVNSKKWFIVGDLIQSVGTVVVGGEEADMSLYFDSLQKVIDFNPMFVFPSHGIGLGGTTKLQLTLRHRKLREIEISKLLDLGNSDVEILHKIYPWLEERLHKYALATIRSHIIKIQSDK